MDNGPIIAVDCENRFSPFYELTGSVFNCCKCVLIPLGTGVRDIAVLHLGS